MAVAVAAGIGRPANSSPIRLDTVSNVAGSDTSTKDMAVRTGSPRWPWATKSR